MDIEAANARILEMLKGEGKTLRRLDPILRKRFDHVISILLAAIR